MGCEQSHDLSCSRWREVLEIRQLHASPANRLSAKSCPGFPTGGSRDQSRLSLSITTQYGPKRMDASVSTRNPWFGTNRSPSTKVPLCERRSRTHTPSGQTISSACLRDTCVYGASSEAKGEKPNWRPMLSLSDSSVVVPHGQSMTAMRGLVSFPTGGVSTTGPLM